MISRAIHSHFYLSLYFSLFAIWAHHRCNKTSTFFYYFQFSQHSFFLSFLPSFCVCFTSKKSHNSITSIRDLYGSFILSFSHLQVWMNVTGVTHRHKHWQTNLWTLKILRWYFLFFYFLLFFLYKKSVCVLFFKFFYFIINFINKNPSFSIKFLCFCVFLCFIFILFSSSSHSHQPHPFPLFLHYSSSASLI